MWSFKPDKASMPTADRLLKGRSTPVQVPPRHFVNGAKLTGPYEIGLERIVLGLGCFWGAERLFWQLLGVVVTAVGYAGGGTPNATYEEVCTGRTGHSEVVLVVFDPKVISLAKILAVFWENHDPTQGMRQGNDVGTQYRSVIYASSEDQLAAARESLALYQSRLSAAGLGKITTEVRIAPEFYFAEAYHQQYLAKNPAGYCGLAGTGITCPTGLAVA